MEIQLKKTDKIFSSRDRAHTLFDVLPQGEVLVIDFEEVDQVTPSFLHEMLNIAKEKGSQIETKNLNESISFQFNKAKIAFANNES